ncbi:MAG: ATP-dependent helicase HrpB [Polyangiales bacterium]
MIELPIDHVLPAIVASLREQPSLVLEAPPGAGKTTRVPRALLDAGFARDGEIVVLQPRRLAARMAARRVADELDENVGRTVGYQVRYDEQSSKDTRIRFVTEGVLTRKLSGGELRGVSCVVLDEFHERHIDGDIALAWLRALQQSARKDLRIVVMSATLDAGPVAEFLGHCPELKSPGRRFDVAVEHAPRTDERPLAEQVAASVRRLVDEGLDGDVLVFLPGAAEIRKCAEALAPVARRAELLVLPLHGELPPEEQDRAVKKQDKRKIVLSTNVAETSVTIDGIVAVIDSGLARIASHAPWSGLPVLRVGRVSKASATQRAGRAGRTRPGRCLRLYTQHDFETRPDFEAPEIARLDLAQMVLSLRAAGVSVRDGWRWFEAPPAAALEAAETLLRRLEALDANGSVTEDGRAMLRFPLHPRLARMLVEAERRGVAKDAAMMAALMSERDIRARGGDEKRFVERGESDLTALLERFDEALADNGRSRFENARNVGLEPGAVASAERALKQLSRMVRDRGAAPKDAIAYDHALRICALTGFADRVARVRYPANNTGRASDGAELVFAFGGTAKLRAESAAHGQEFVVALDAEERNDGRGAQVTVRTASGIEPDWLLELYTDQCEDRVEALFDKEREHVTVKRRLMYGSLVLDESIVREPDPTLVAAALATAAINKGVRHFVEGDALDRLLGRMRFVRAQFGAEAMPDTDEKSLTGLVREACVGMRSFDELRKADLVSLMLATLEPAQRRLLDEAAPERVELPGGRRAKIEYPQDAAPYVESRMQDFFGMADGPKIAKGRVALVLHLLAPNQRAVQVTTDLAGFWSKHYPTIAKELRRKYPRHPFPEDPTTASPPQARRG